jgi:hypothetical protein
MENLKKTIQSKYVVEELMQQIYEIKEENKSLTYENRRLTYDKDLLYHYKKDCEKTKDLLELQEDRVLELKIEKNTLKRQLNRVTYNKIKTIAVILSLEDQKYLYKKYIDKGEIKKCPFTWKQYAELTKKEQKAWREYADYYYRLNHWSLNDGKH